jgi:serine/threonine protein kinase
MNMPVMGIVHGDVKPVRNIPNVLKDSLTDDFKKNVLVDDNGNARLCDFGLSKAIRPEAGPIWQTTNQSPKGTYPYMAPELFEDESLSTMQSDVYALGITAWVSHR